MNIVQTKVVTQQPRLTLDVVPTDGNALALFVGVPNAASPYGVASSWTRVVTSGIEEWRGAGPFSGTTITLTAGRTPPSLDAVCVEVG